MEILECTAGAVGASTMRLATAVVRPAVSASRTHLLPIVRTHSLAGVRLYEVQGQGMGWCGQETATKDAMNGADPISFPTRLGPPPPDCPPVN